MKDNGEITIKDLYDKIEKLEIAYHKLEIKTYVIATSISVMAHLFVATAKAVIK